MLPCFPNSEQVAKREDMVRSVSRSEPGRRRTSTKGPKFRDVTDVNLIQMDVGTKS